MSPESIVAFQTKMGESCRVKLFAWKSEKEKRKTAAWVLKKVLEHATGYGKPNGAKFKKQNWLHVQQICDQGQGQSSSTKSIHVQPIFSQGQDI